MRRLVKISTVYAFGNQSLQLRQTKFTVKFCKWNGEHTFVLGRSKMPVEEKAGHPVPPSHQRPLLLTWINPNPSMDK